jgi:hypothetical protein
MDATVAELTRPEANADRDFLPQDWCGTCQEAREPQISSAGQHLRPGWALAAVRDAVREGRLDFQVTGLRPDLANPEIVAAVEEHQARPTRYEKLLNIPAAFARTHQRGTRWRQFEMCRAQWQQLQAIRERDRLRKQRKSELDRAVERELQEMLPQRETVASHC